MLWSRKEFPKIKRSNTWKTNLKFLEKRMGMDEEVCRWKMTIGYNGTSPSIYPLLDNKTGDWVEYKDFVEIENEVKTLRAVNKIYSHSKKIVDLKDKVWALADAIDDLKRSALF